MQCIEIILIPKIIIVKYEIFLGTWKVIFHFLKKDKKKNTSLIANFIELCVSWLGN